MKQKLLNGLAGIVVALLIGAIVMLVQGYNPVETYLALFDYSLGSWYAFSTMLKNSVPLILTGLSAAVAFGSGAINLGQPGQLLIGALFATVAGLYLDLPPALMIPVMLVAAALGGLVWSGAAALMRRWFNMDEFITTLMLNMIADFFTYWAISYPFAEPGANSPMTPPIGRGGWMPEIGPFNTSIVVMLVALAVTWFISTRTTAGYEWRISGQNSLFARLGGVKTGRNFVAVMLLTGALAGLAGGLIVMAGPHRFIKDIGANYAWDGVMVAMVANNGIIATLLYGLFFATLQTGALGMELITAVPRELIMVLQAIVLLVVMAGRGYFDIIANRLAEQQKTRERAT